MFKRKFKNEFEFSDASFLLKNEKKSNDFDHSVFVIYEYSELIDFFKSEYKSPHCMIFLFSKYLYSSLSLIEEIKGLMLIDATKTKTEIFQDLKMFFKKPSNLIPKLSDKKLVKLKMSEKQLEALQRALFFRM
ncbi:hypothetical protein [Flavobacterium defluvii]|nr:hypothetical protein [Flavobacterium defluvii]